MATQEFKGTSWPFIRVHKRRFILFVIFLVGLLFLSFTQWELPLPSISRANVAQLIGSRSVDEIYGVLHVVTTEHGHRLNAADLPVNPTAPSELSLYTKDPTLNWRKEKGRIDQNYPVIVFSKVHFTDNLLCLHVLFVCNRAIARMSFSSTTKHLFKQSWAY
jgi:hypothetical protein